MVCIVNYYQRNSPSLPVELMYYEACKTYLYFYMRCIALHHYKCIQERTTTLHRIIFRIFIFVLVSFSCETWGRRFPVLILLCRTWGKKTCNTHNILQSVQFSLDTSHILEEGQKHGGGGMLITLNDRQFAVFNSKSLLCPNQITNFKFTQLLHGKCLHIFIIERNNYDHHIEFTRENIDLEVFFNFVLAARHDNMLHHTC